MFHPVHQVAAPVGRQTTLFDLNFQVAAPGHSLPPPTASCYLSRLFLNAWIPFLLFYQQRESIWSELNAPTQPLASATLGPPINSCWFSDASIEASELFYLTEILTLVLICCCHRSHGDECCRHLVSHSCSRTLPYSDRIFMRLNLSTHYIVSTPRCVHVSYNIFAYSFSVTLCSQQLVLLTAWKLFPSHPIDGIWALTIVWRLGGKIIRTVLCCILSFSPGNSLVSSWCDHSMLASLLWQFLIVPSLPQFCWYYDTYTSWNSS